LLSNNSNFLYIKSFFSNI